MVRLDRRAINEMFDEELRLRWDTNLAECALVRRRRSLKYTRRVGDAAQELELVYQLRPTFARDALAHVLPIARILIKDVNALAARIASEDRGYAQMSDSWTYGTNVTNLGETISQLAMTFDGE